MIKKKLWLVCVLVLALVLSGCGESSDQSKSGDVGKKVMGGTLEVAYPTQPQTLDPQATTAEATRDVAKLIYESLVTLNKNYEVIPQLAESYKVSDDRKTVTFTLRKGVKFHNGNEMTADDVVASMKKWSEATKALGKNAWKVVDENTVALQLAEPSSLTLYMLADQGNIAAIMPKDVAEGAEATGATEYIGTGPFMFVDWKKDKVIHLKKFADYTPDSEPADGLGGKKEALLDKINWNFVPDASTRVNGLMSGQYDFAHMISYDSIPQLESAPGVKVNVWSYGIEGLIFNKKQGLFTNLKARQAVNKALDVNAIMKAAFTSDKYYDLDPSLFLPSQKDWYTDAGKENYNQQDIDEAKKLLKEAGYKGQTIKILTSRDYEHHYNAAVATQQQLKKIGMNVKLDVYDWPTLLERRGDAGAYDIFFTGFSTTTTPNQFVFLDSKIAWPGWTKNEKIDQLLGDIVETDSKDKAKALYADLQKEMWDYLPIINLGKNSRVSGYSEKLKGYQNMLGPNFWNVSKAK